MQGKRLVFTAPRRAELQPFEIPAPGPYQVLVRTTCTLVSAGTELKAYLGAEWGGRNVSYPRSTGYSHVGIVEAIGSAVIGIKPGDRVATLKPHASHVLVDLSPVPVPPSAALPAAQWPRAPDWLQPIPNGVSDEQATFAVLGSVAMHGVRKAGLHLDESCAIAGQGVVGQLVGQLAKLNGARPVIAIDPDAARLDASRRSGLDVQIQAPCAGAVDEVMALTEGRGIDVGFDCTVTTQAFPGLLRLAAFEGRIIVVGSLLGTVEISLYEELQFKELTIVGVHQPKAPGWWHPAAPWTQAANRKAVLDLIASGRLHVDHLISHRVPAEQAPALYEQMAQGPRGWLGVLFEW